MTRAKVRRDCSPAVAATALFTLGLITTSAAQPQRDEVERCLEGDRISDCLEETAGRLLERALSPAKIELLPGVYLERAASREGRAMDRDQDANRTISVDLIKVADGYLSKGARGKKKRRRYILLAVLTAIISAKLASILTAKAILIPLALKGITFLAIKALMIGKVAVVVASAFGFLRLISQPEKSKTEIIYDVKEGVHKRLDPTAPGSLALGLPQSYSVIRSPVKKVVIPQVRPSVQHHHHQHQELVQEVQNQPPMQQQAVYIRRPVMSSDDDKKR